jgi:predicted DNA-binding transcriptional regulator AlpA
MAIDTRHETAAAAAAEARGDILHMADMVRLFRSSRSNIVRHIREGTFPIAPMPRVIDRKYRWWGPAVRDWLVAQNHQPATPSTETPQELTR